MKRFTRLLWLAGLLTLCLCLALTACDGGEGDVTTPTLAPTEAPTDTAAATIPESQPTTEPAPETDVPTGGCSSTVAIGVLMLLIPPAWVCLCKKEK